MIGKCLGGATVAGFQGVIVICLAGLVRVPYAPLLIIEVFVLQLLLAFAITAFGVMIAVRIKQMQSFMGVMQMVVMPMFYLRRPVPRLGPAQLAHRAQPHRPAHLRGRSDAPDRVQPPAHLRAGPPRAGSRASPGGAGGYRPWWRPA